MAKNDLFRKLSIGSDIRWSYTPQSFEAKKEAADQHVSDMQIWDSTLFSEGAFSGNTLAQQNIMRHHFLAMAYFGVNYLNGETEGGVPLEFQRPNVPLAAIPSHGGRFAFEVSEPYSSGDTLARFKNIIFTGRPEVAPVVHKDQKRANKRPQNGDPGLYTRMSTHGQKLVKTTEGSRKWREVKLKTGEPGHIGMNFPLGGIGNTVIDTKGRPTRIGPDGHASTVDGRKSYQLGTALFAARVDNKNHSARIMVGFEGTAPHEKNQLGVSHGFRSTVFGTILGIKKYKNERSATGQLKGERANMPGDLGALGSTVTESKLQGFSNFMKGVRILESDRTGREELRVHFRKLLSSTTSIERHQVIKSIDNSAYETSQRRPGSAQNLGRPRNEDASRIIDTVKQLSYDPRMLASYISLGNPERNTAAYQPVPVSGVAKMRTEMQGHSREISGSVSSTSSKVVARSCAHYDHAQSFPRRMG
ncbi:hypothetical protein [Streptomyces sp. NPDC088847]|uniref:hypothetical protein n=1 Tax=Streptomyces sp. NPDC088847 TaxID=3365909 RepID=UPI0037FF3F2D